MGAKVFNNAKVAPQGWYWLLPSAQLKKGQTKSVEIFGRSLVLFRETSGRVNAFEAYCAHMGAHLGAGRVEGDCLRCPFHGWKYSASGRCEETPSIPQRERDTIALEIFRVTEKYGMIWLHTDKLSTEPLPEFSALAGRELVTRLDPAETRLCHPTLILGGGVDEVHFNFVHAQTTQKTGPLRFEWKRISPSVIRFENAADIPRDSAIGRFMHRLYKGVLGYKVTYFSASTALAELGTPEFPLYSIFAYRPTPDGRTEGLNIYVTPKRSGPWGALASRFALALTRSLLLKGGAEDRVIQNAIRFKFGPHALSNPPFAAFVEYVESQPIFSMRGRND